MERSEFTRLAFNEASTRLYRHSPLPIIDYTLSGKGKKVLVPPGSVTAFVGYKNSSIISRLKNLTKENEVQLAEEILKKYEGRKAQPYDKLWRILSAAPVFADLRYGGKPLATNICIPMD